MFPKSWTMVFWGEEVLIRRKKTWIYEVILFGIPSLRITDLSNKKAQG